MISNIIFCHSLFLTEKERYSLIEGDAISVVGVGFASDINSRRAVKEVFSKYNLIKGNKSLILTKENFFDLLVSYKDTPRLANLNEKGSKFISLDLVENLKMDDEDILINHIITINDFELLKNSVTAEC